jgi:MinD-like ATPase involved in chromosome partitioning or flagellar assembly/ActR/RegA family two-component response regulator
MQQSAYRILLIEDSPADERLFKETLAEAHSVWFVLECASTLSQALERITRGDLDLIVSDLTLPDSRGIETFNTLQERQFGIPIIVLTGEQDGSLGVRAVREGAQDYLLKGELSPPALARSIVYAIERHRQYEQQLQKVHARKVGRVISFMGAKGGVGATTVVHNVAAVLARQYSTLVVELSPSAETLSHFTCTEPGNDLSGLLEMDPVRIGSQEVSARICRLPQGLQVLFSPQTSDKLLEIDAAHATAIVDQACGLADYVILDLPRYPSSGTQAAAGHSHFVVLVTSPEEIAVASGRSVLGLLKLWGLGTTLAGTVIVNSGRVMNSLRPAQVGSQLGCQIVGVIPPIPEPFQSYKQSGLPIVISGPDSNAALAFIDLANRLTGDPVRPLDI